MKILVPIFLLLLAVQVNAQTYSYKCNYYKVGKGQVIRQCSYIPVYKAYEVRKQEQVKGRRNRNYHDRQYTSYFRRNRYRKYEPSRPMIEN
jgi:hypothetical protein